MGDETLMVRLGYSQCIRPVWYERNRVRQQEAEIITIG